jgi:hypothetical protein
MQPPPKAIHPARLGVAANYPKRRPLPSPISINTRERRWSCCFPTAIHRIDLPAGRACALMAAARHRPPEKDHLRRDARRAATQNEPPPTRAAFPHEKGNRELKRIVSAGAIPPHASIRKLIMQTLYTEPYRKDPACEIRLGKASWDDTDTSVKYTYFIANGAAARPGEVPADALPQMTLVAAKSGHFAPAELADLIEQLASALKNQLKN